MPKIFKNASSSCCIAAHALEKRTFCHFAKFVHGFSHGCCRRFHFWFGMWDLHVTTLCQNSENSIKQHSFKILIFCRRNVAKIDFRALVVEERWRCWKSEAVQVDLRCLKGRSHARMSSPWLFSALLREPKCAPAKLSNEASAFKMNQWVAEFFLK